MSNPERDSIAWASECSSGDHVRKGWERDWEGRGVRRLSALAGRKRKSVSPKAAAGVRTGPDQDAAGSVIHRAPGGRRTGGGDRGDRRSTPPGEWPGGCAVRREQAAVRDP